MSERVLPHNLEAEESVLGSMMLSPDAIPVALEALQAEDFYRSKHAATWGAICNLYARGEPVEVFSVVEELQRTDRLDAAGGKLAIADMVSRVTAPSSVGYYARLVAEKAALRRLVHAGGEITELGFSNPLDIGEAIDKAESLAYAAARRERTEQLVEVGESVSATIDELERIQAHGGQLTGLATGFLDIDHKLGGLQPENLIILAARPGVGKSALAANVARNVTVDSGVRVALFSLEMSHREIGQRLLASESGVPWTKMRDGKLGLEDWQKITLASEKLLSAPFSIIDSGTMTILDIRARARRLKQQGLGLAIVDYLQLMGHHRSVESRQQEVSEISRGLKLLAKELAIPVIGISQLNREVEMRGKSARPRLSDLRESGSLEQDADIVIFLHRPDEEPKPMVEVEAIIAKNRNGPTDTVHLLFEPRCVKFRNLAATEARAAA